VGNLDTSAAVSSFMGSPQPVEIHHRGIWYSGELLGWRHDDDGRVVARVRCVVDKLRHSTWKDLAELRLPDPKRPPRAEPYPASPGVGLDPFPDDDTTRPHVFLAAMQTRPRKPEHARTPPAVETPAPAPRPVAAPLRPAPRVPAPALSVEPLPDRRRPRPAWEPTALTGV
jgi:hypothetical protein